MAYNGSGIAEGGDYLHKSPSEAQKFNVVQLLISGTSAPTFGNTLLAAGIFKLSKWKRTKLFTVVWFQKATTRMPKLRFNSQK